MVVTLVSRGSNPLRILTKNRNYSGNVSRSIALYFLRRGYLGFSVTIFNLDVGFCGLLILEDIPIKAKLQK